MVEKREGFLYNSCIDFVDPRGEYMKTQGLNRLLSVLSVLVLISLACNALSGTPTPIPPQPQQNNLPTPVPQQEIQPSATPVP
jgi:hypothetical protein